MEQNNKQTEGKTTQEITKVKKKNFFICNLFKYLFDRKFSIVWIFFIFCLIFALFPFLGSSSSHWEWSIYRIGILIFLGCFILFLFHKPLNVVYGLIGTKGHIRTYLMLLVVINVIFSCIYKWGFFSKAGITYDINQPYIAYNMFPDKKEDIKVFHKPDEKVRVYNVEDSLVSYWIQPGEDIHFQRIKCKDVFKNTLMTSLMQEPSELFAIASTYNEGVDNFIKGPDDRQKSQLFHTLLILQIFISWIFFGVFISILYNKFRYES